MTGQQSDWRNNNKQQSLVTFIITGNKNCIQIMEAAKLNVGFFVFTFLNTSIYKHRMSCVCFCGICL